MENYEIVLNQLRNFGLNVDFLEIDTASPIRCCYKDEKKKNGWYWLNTVSIKNKTYIVGGYGVWKGDHNPHRISMNDFDGLLSKKEKSFLQKQWEEKKKKIQQEKNNKNKEASTKAVEKWSNCISAGESDYLKKKRVKPFGIRFDPSEKGVVVIPIRDIKGNIWGLQLINDDKNKIQKKYWPEGLKKKGNFHLISNEKFDDLSGRVLVTEGYATGATLHEATGLSVIVAFDSGNLSPVCEAIKKANFKIKIIVCADDDYLTDGNPGINSAKKAAGLVNGEVVVPDFVIDGIDIRKGKKLTDFNDLACHTDDGLNIIKEQINANKNCQKNNYLKKKAVSQMTIDALVERFRHIDNDSGGFVFDEWTKNICKVAKMKEMIQPGRKFDEVKNHPLWSERAVFMDQIGFDPTCKDESIVCNRYDGWDTIPNKKATKEDCRAILKLLSLLCMHEGQDEKDKNEVMDWVLKWLAYPIQNPGAKMATALIFHGRQGTGKSLFFEVIRKIYGKYGMIINQGAMEDSFNSDWVDKKLFVVADEVIANTQKYHLKNDIKTKITGDYMRINKKMVEAYNEKNYMNLVFLSNESNPVVLENDDRRFFVVWTSIVYDEEFYDEVNKEIANGGVESFHQYLLDYDLKGFHKDTKPLKTSAKKDLINLNLSPQQSFLKHWKNGDILSKNRGREILPYGVGPCSLLFQVFQEWAAFANEKYSGSLRYFSSDLKKEGWSEGKIKRVYVDSNKKKVVRIRFFIADDKSIEETKENGTPVFTREMSEDAMDFYTRIHNSYQDYFTEKRF